MQNQINGDLAIAEKTEYIRKMQTNIPQELQQIPHWVCYKLEWDDGKQKLNKVPHDIRGYKVAIKNSNINKYGKFEDALKTYFDHPKGFNGIGFVFTNTNDLIGIDVDNCIKNGQLNEFHKALIMGLKSYSEFSPSGNGFHVIIKGKLDPSWGNKANDKVNGIGYEIYEQERFFTFTANPIINDYKIINTVGENELKDVYEKYFNVFKTSDIDNKNNVISISTSRNSNSQTNQEFIELGLKKDRPFKTMYEGQRQSDDESSNDYALCCKLAFWSNHDPDLMLQVLLESPYFKSKTDSQQSKWLERRNDQYANATIMKAIQTTKTTAAEKNAKYKAKQELKNQKVIQIPQQSQEDTEILTFPFMNYESKNPKPLRVWENIAALMKFYKIEAKFDEIKRETIISGLDSKDIDDCVLDIHSLCLRHGLNVAVDFIGQVINRIGNENKFNPIVEFLENSEKKWDGLKRVQFVSETMIVTEDFSKELRDLLFKKWLVSTVRIAHNDGTMKTEGAFILQGPQGIGKTRWICSLIPKHLRNYFSEGVKLDVANKDSVFESISNWIVELGELDGTLKADQAELKAFFTRQIDIQRRPYAKTPSNFPRRTSFFGTVNKSNFLKDETGDRRYWIVPVTDLKNDYLDQVDLEQFWGEVMHIWKTNEVTHYLNQDESKLLSESNEEYRVVNELQARIQSSFEWQSPEFDWNFVATSDIMVRLDLKTSSGLKEAIVSCGGKVKRTKYARGFIVPKFK